MLDFNEQMKKLKGVNGYIGAAILNKQGETLYLDEEGTSSDIVYAASVLNDSFLEISEASIDVGFSPINMLETQTTDGHVFIIKSVEGKDESSHLTFFTIFKDKGNISLAKMVIDRSATRILAMIDDI